MCPGCVYVNSMPFCMCVCVCIFRQRDHFKNYAIVCSQLRAHEWMEGDDFNTEAVMNICGECDAKSFT